MGVITPTLTLTSKAAGSSPASDAGPLSFAFQLSATDTLSIDQVATKIIDVDGTHGVLWDASDYITTSAAGTKGGFVYVKNITAEGSGRNIMIGTANSGLSDEVDLTSTVDAERLFTLQPGEFAFFPWDMTFDLYEDANGSTSNALETWLFVRTGTN